MHIGAADSIDTWMGRALERLGGSRDLTKPYQTSNTMEAYHGVRLREISLVAKRETAQTSD